MYLVLTTKVLFKCQAVIVKPVHGKFSSFLISRLCIQKVLLGPLKLRYYGNEGWGKWNTPITPSS